MDVISMLNDAEPATAKHTEPRVVGSGRNSTDSSNSLPTPSPERTVISLHTPMSSTATWKNAKGDLDLRIDTARLQVHGTTTPRSPESGLDSSLPSSLGAHSRTSSVDSTRQRISASATSAPDNHTRAGQYSFSRPSVETSQEMARDEPVKSATSEAEPEANCMFVKNCDTGSQLRKAISHLFGRNKACTLRIPKHVWVYYCRKHYQRIRYRNAKTYPLNQMELVKLQICRLQTWSDENKVAGSGPFIKLWTLSLRKREQNRIEHRDDASEGGRGAADAGGVPKWLLEKVGTGYTTDDMLDVADRLYSEIQNGRLSQIPEVEFLPDIVESQAESRKTNRRRKSSTHLRTPKRKASEESESLRRSSDEAPYRDFYRRPSSFDGHEDPASPSGKRVRVYHQHEAALPSLAAAIPYESLHRESSHARVHSIPRMQSFEYQVDRSASYPGNHRHSVSVGAEYPAHSSSHASARHVHARDYRDSALPSIRGELTNEERGRRPSTLGRHEPPGGGEYHEAYDAGRPQHMRSSSAYTLASRPVGGLSQPHSHVPRGGDSYAYAQHDRRGEEERARAMAWQNSRETLAYRPQASNDHGQVHWAGR